MKRYILILDLDETLLHTNDNDRTIWRPYVKKFLEELDPYVYFILYTAALKLYADPLLEKYNIKKYFIKKFYRNSCISLNNDSSKNLDIILNSLLKDKLNNKNNIPKSILIKNKKLNYNNILFIDNLEENCILQRRNSIIIKDYYGQKKDTALKHLLKFIKNIIRFSNENIPYYLKKNIHNVKKFIKN